MSVSLETRTVEPTARPVTLDELKRHVRNEGSDDNFLLEDMIDVATAQVERDTGRQLLTATYTLWLDRFHGVICLPRAPLASVTSVEYVDSAGDLQTVSTSSYEVDSGVTPGRIFRASNASWPTPGRSRSGVKITYIAGWTTASSVPRTLRQAVLVAAAHYYEHRGDVEGLRPLERLPLGYRGLIASWVVPYAYGPGEAG